MAITLAKIISNPSLTKLQKKLKNTFADLRKRFSSQLIFTLGVNTIIVIFQVVYLRLRFAYLNEEIPLWYTKLWGDYQLAEKNYLYLIPLISAAITVVGISFAIPIRRYFFRYALNVINIFTITANLILTASLLRIIFRASIPFEPLINPIYLGLFVTGLVSFLAVNFVLPRFINYAKEKDIVTSPTLHQHPGMLLSQPSTRGGGFIYGISFLILAIIFEGFPTDFLPFYLALFLISLLGFLDDLQNTRPESKLKFLENPFVRLFLMFLVVSVVSVLGQRIFYISNPVGGLFFFDSPILSAIITTVWIVWVLNVLSWSNGIDGQYAGIVGIASFLIVLLALRFHPVQIEHIRVATLAAISAGLSFGFIKFTWHPSKILWGFGAISAGLVLSVLSIMVNSKIITSIIIILIPFLDALVTVVRRLLQGKNPLKGDRGHLHHILLNRGWSIRRIAVFYWLTTAIFGGIGYLTSDALTLQIGFILLGIVAFFIVLLNIKLDRSIIAPEKPLHEEE
jgi:UDP-GlcNAc:undecaprenyl-phosphate GlcNAc-1-phosphate transferase